MAQFARPSSDAFAARAWKEYDSERSWKICYDDGTAFSSEDGKVKDARADGVQVIAEKRDGRTLLHVYGELYAWFDGGWTTGTARKSHWPEDAIILHGLWMDTDRFVLLKEEAIAWLHSEV